MDNKKIKESLKKYLDEERLEMKKNFNRILPTNELLYDRWEKAALIKAGEGSSIYDTSVIMGDVKIGNNVWIGPFTMIEAINGKITIGDNCDISTGVQIYTHDSCLRVVSGGRKDLVKGDVTILENTYIGSMSIIKHGVKIGKRCIIGANSFVNKDIEDYSVACGTPAKIVGKVILKDDYVGIKYYR